MELVKVDKYGIIAIGYNRPDSMKRLLDALSKAEYFQDDVLLIISIDNSGTSDVETIANSFAWKNGDKIIITYDERQGLRKHILTCGTYLERYGLKAVAVFEDDIYPSPAFYNFMKQAVPFYENDMSIAGISLYSHLINVNINKPFIPAKGNADVYFMQFAQSWGQIWMRKQWEEFSTWYIDNSEEFRMAKGVPEFVAGWPNTSWLKYHIRYCIENNKFFVYPYFSLATCYTDAGEHNKTHNTLYQVTLEKDYQRNYKFVGILEADVVYDSFFERLGVGKWLGIPDTELCMNLYGSKVDVTNKKYLITMEKHDLQVIYRYGLEMRPHEDNIFFDIRGEDIFVYDCRNVETINTLNEKRNDLFFYYYKFVITKEFLINNLKERVHKKIHKLFIYGE